ncbi:DUF362 domain-containing protein [Chloroflexota bacterium]
MASKVAITQVEQNDIESAVRKAVNLAGGLDRVIKKTSKVLVKPNLFRPEISGSGLVTNAMVTEAVTKIAMELKPKSVVIGEGSAAGWDKRGYSTQESFIASGTDEIAKRLGVEFRNLNIDEAITIDIPNANVMNKVRIAKTVIESDVVISVPVLKTHSLTNVSLSIKNMKGAMPGPEKRNSHRLGLDLAIADLISVVRPTYAIVDATTGMEGAWQYPDDTKQMNLIIAGNDPLAVDIVGASLMSIDPNQILHLRYAAQKENIEIESKRIVVVGEPIEKHRQQFKGFLEVFEKRFPNVKIIHGKSACTGCTAKVRSALQYTRDAGYEEALKGLTIIIGNAIDPEVTEKVAVWGVCAREFSNLGAYVTGCPPSEEDVIKTICRACDINGSEVLAVREESHHRLWQKSDISLKQ